MRYLVGFKNGTTVIIEADEIQVTSSNNIAVLNGNKIDAQTYVAASEVLFVAPESKAVMKHYAVGPSNPPK